MRWPPAWPAKGSTGCSTWATFTRPARAEEYRTLYHPSWGRFKRITHPTPGNHEWGNRSVGYDPYWGKRAPRHRGGHYYSFNIGRWHFVSLNSHEDSGPRSSQAAWLAAGPQALPGHLHHRLSPSRPLHRRAPWGRA